MNPTKLADVLHGAYRVIGDDVPEAQRWLAVSFAAIGALESKSTSLIAALKKYGQHKPTCAVNGDDRFSGSSMIVVRNPKPCDCGLSAVLGVEENT